MLFCTFIHHTQTHTYRFPLNIHDDLRSVLRDVRGGRDDRDECILRDDVAAHGLDNGRPL